MNIPARVIVIVLLAILAVTWPSQAQMTSKISIDAKPANFARLSFGSPPSGQLEFRGGLLLSSTDERFGGFSGLAFSADGTALLAVSDEGWWLRADVEYHNDRPAALANAVLAPLLAKDGRRPKSKRNRDAEAIALDRSGEIDGEVYVGFESRARLEKFDMRRHGLAAKPLRLHVPASLAKGPYNRQFEALGKLTHGPWRGSLIALSERNLDREGNIRGWVIAGETSHGFSIKRLEDYDITDLAVMPDGSIVTLERSYVTGGLPGMALRRFPQAAPKPGAVVTPALLFSGRQPFYLIDNMEGIAVHRWKDELRITVLSDDNYNRGAQRTVLFQFALSK
ncbi:MAG TPA: esterase-like activity of phytase family protein [Aestuariivirgaceae bacterium]|jgi:hypothetical protein